MENENGVDPGLMKKLAAMFGGGGAIGDAPELGQQPEMGQLKRMDPIVPSELPDSSAASAGPVSMPIAGSPAGMPKSPEPHGGLMDALKNLMTFFNAKQGSASNEGRYQKALEEAGIPAAETGIAQ